MRNFILRRPRNFLKKEYKVVASRINIEIDRPIKYFFKNIESTLILSISAWNKLLVANVGNITQLLNQNTCSMTVNAMKYRQLRHVIVTTHILSEASCYSETS